MAKHGAFLQLASMSADDIVKYCEWVKQNRQDFDDLCVTAIADADGILYTDKIFALKPYLPGQPKAAFSNVFFGSATDYRGASSPYDTDMLSSDFRWRNLHLQKSVLSALRASLTGVRWHCYIEHEAALDKLIKNNLRAAYEAYLIQSVRDLRAINPGCAVLWSPAFWQTSIPSGLEEKLTVMFDNIKQNTDGIGINWLHLQDCQGRFFNPSYQDSMNWYNMLPVFPSKRMNLEYFEQTSTGLVPADRTEVEARIQAYTTAGVPLGISWELRWIYRVRQQVVAVNPFESSFIESAYYGRADNISFANRQEVRTWLETGKITGLYSARAAVTAKAAKLLTGHYPLEVQGARYMRPYIATVVPGRSVNSDHLTAGALDVFFRTDIDKNHYAAVKEILDGWKGRNVVRYYLDLGSNWAHRDHIHVSFQLGVRP